MLSLDGSLVPADAEGLGVAAVVAVELIDGAGNEPGALGQAVAALEGLLRDHPPVLVHCHAGRSRSVVVVAGLLTRTLRIGTAEAIARVAARHGLCRHLSQIIECQARAENRADNEQSYDNGTSVRAHTRSP